MVVTVRGVWPINDIVVGIKAMMWNVEMIIKSQS